MAFRVMNSNIFSTADKIQFIKANEQYIIEALQYRAIDIKAMVAKVEAPRSLQGQA